MATDKSRLRAVEDSEELEVMVGSTVVVSTPEFPDPFSTPQSTKGLNATMRKRMSRANLEKANVTKTGGSSTRLEQKDVSGYNLYEVASPPFNLDYLSQLMNASEAHSAAVKAKVSNVVGLGYDFINSHKTKMLLDNTDSEEKAAKRRKNLQNMKNQLFDMVDGLNPDDEFIETLIKVYTDYEATGNGFFEIGRGAFGEIAYLGHIPAATMRVRIARDGFVQIASNKAVFFRNFAGDATDPIGNDESPNEIIHLKKYNPTNSYYGVPDVIPALAAIAGNKFASQYNLDYFENKAVPRYVIIIKGGRLAAGQDKKIVDFFEANLKGIGGNHRTLFIPLPADDGDKKSSFEMKPVEAGAQDSSWNEYDKSNLNKILMADRVPITKVSMAEGQALAAARDADKTFKEQVCRPEQRIIEKKLGKVFRQMTDVFNFKLNELTLTDEDTQSQIDERYLRMQVILPNEVRARWGWSGIKGGDKVVDLKPQQAADAKATATQSRTRDAQRSATAPDKQGEARAPKGEGRQVK